MKKKIIAILIVVCLLIAFGATVTIEWLYETFGHLSMDEIIFHLKVPMEGTNTDIVYLYIKECLWKVILPTLIISIMLIYPMLKDIKIINKIHTSKRRRTALISSCIAVAILVVSVNKITSATDIKQYVTDQLNSSTFIQDEYVAPEKVALEFPEKKRNLIYIFLESMEATYYQKEDGGLSDNDLIPEISKLAKENICFTDNTTLGGADTLYGTTWTVGAMVAQTAGLPLKLSIDDNSLGEYSVFLGGAYSIGEILEENGYHNFLLLGSDATFGGRSNLFKQHGNYEIWDFQTALAENRVSEKIWWGYPDDLLFKYAKEQILNLASKEEPFNFTMLTADTHFPHGYFCQDCQNVWDEQYKNVISCSSKRVGEFIEWIKQQDFYDNTTIVIAGDHLTMQSNFFELEEGQEYDKKVVNVIINSAVQTENTTNRKYSTMDLYPTTLASLGVKIDGDRLALGTNLFSNENTLIEKYGLEYVNNELKKTSKFYNSHILVSK